MAREPFVLLADAAAGHAGRVLRVDDRDPELLRALESVGLDIGDDVVVIPGGVRIAGADTALPVGAAEVVWLSA